MKLIIFLNLITQSKNYNYKLTFFKNYNLKYFNFKDLKLQKTIKLFKLLIIITITFRMKDLQKLIKIFLVVF